MPIPTSPVDICNLALDYLGQENGVTDIDAPTTEEETVAARWYDTTRQQILRKFTWNFAKKRAILAPSADVPAFEYSAAFPLPSDCLRILSVGTDALSYLRQYDLENRRILVSEATTGKLYLKYIYDAVDVSKFDPLFINILTLQLALNMGYKYTLKASVVQRVNELLGIEERKAISVDAQERPPRRIERSSVMADRRRLGDSYYAGKYTPFEPWP